MSRNNLFREKSVLRFVCEVIVICKELRDDETVFSSDAWPLLRCHHFEESDWKSEQISAPG